MVVEILVYATLAIAIVAIELSRARAAPYDALFLFNASYFVYFVLAPLHVLIGGKTFVRQSWTFEHYGGGGIGISVWLLASYILVLAGYAVVPRFRSPMAALNVRLAAWQWSGISALMVGLVAFLLYSYSVSGVGTALWQASYIRQRVYEVEGAFLFAKHLIPMAIAGVFLLLVYKYDQREGHRIAKRKLAVWFFLLIVTILAVALVLGGRRVVLIPLIVLFFLWSNTSGRWHLRSGLAFGLVGIVFLSLWDVVGWGLRDFQFEKYFSQRFDSLHILYAVAVQPLADSYIHWVGIFNQDTPVWAFRDWLVWPAYVLPSGLFPGIEIPSVIEYTTPIFTGKNLGEVAAEPPGFHGYFYMSAGFYGLVLGSVLFGMLLKTVHRVCLPRGNSAREWLVYIWVSFGMVYFVRHGMVEFVLTERFHWWLGLGILSFWALVFGIRIAPSAANSRA